MAAAHALQDSGHMLDVDTQRLFSNMPDVLNASLYFWEATFYPMLSDALENHTMYVLLRWIQSFSGYDMIYQEKL